MAKNQNNGQGSAGSLPEKITTWSVVGTDQQFFTPEEAVDFIENNKKGLVSSEEIAAWKTQHGDVYAIEFECEFEMDEENRQITIIRPAAIAYFKKPSRSHLKLANSKMAQTKSEIVFNESIINSCFIGGFADVKTNDAYFLGASGVIGEMIDVVQASIAKL